MPVNALFLCAFLSALLYTGQVIAQDDWYQIDVIVFKPAVVNLDDEIWPSVQPVYPANVLSVHQPSPFKLSQLEQAALTLDESSVVETPSLNRDDFVFKSASRSNRNRRVIESVTSSDTSAVDTFAENEQAPDDEPPQGLSIDDLIATALTEGNPDSPGNIAFTRTEDQSSLTKVLGSLRRSSRFEVLTHQSWIQPLGAEGSPMMIQTGQRYDDRFEIEGTLSFRRSRFLHVDTQLWYTVFEPREIGANPFLRGFESTLPDAVLQEHRDLVAVERQRGQYFPARTHVMDQTRRMRSNELHYLDHPLFGIVVQINQVPTPE